MRLVFECTISDTSEPTKKELNKKVHFPAFKKLRGPSFLSLCNGHKTALLVARLCPSDLPHFNNFQSLRKNIFCDAMYSTLEKNVLMIFHYFPCENRKKNPDCIFINVNTIIIVSYRIFEQCFYADVYLAFCSAKQLPSKDRVL